MNPEEEFVDEEEEPTPSLRRVTNLIIGAAIEVHRALGPGLLESVYETCLAHELTRAGVPMSRQVPIPLLYKGVRLETGFRADLVVDGCVLVEVKAAERLLPIHDAQVLTYLRLAGLRTGILLNFNVKLLKDGVRRLVV